MSVATTQCFNYTEQRPRTMRMSNFCIIIIHSKIHHELTWTSLKAFCMHACTHTHTHTHTDWCACNTHIHTHTHPLSVIACVNHKEQHCCIDDTHLRNGVGALQRQFTGTTAFLVSILLSEPLLHLGRCCAQTIQNCCSEIYQSLHTADWSPSSSGLPQIFTSDTL